MVEITEYPATAWVLQPSFKPVEVTLTRRLHEHGYQGWHATAKGQPHHQDKLHATKHEAITVGRAQVATLEADLVKRRASLNKRIAALDKAEGIATA